MRLDDAFHVAIRMKTLFRAADDGRESDLRRLMSNVSRTERRGDRRWTKCGANETRKVTMSQCRFDNDLRLSNLQMFYIVMIELSTTSQLGDCLDYFVRDIVATT
jgi:hypothetical protein